jgi:hypothetical protein
MLKFLEEGGKVLLELVDSSAYLASCVSELTPHVNCHRFMCHVDPLSIAHSMQFHTDYYIHLTYLPGPLTLVYKLNPFVVYTSLRITCLHGFPHSIL